MVTRGRIWQILVKVKEIIKTIRRMEKKEKWGEKKDSFKNISFPPFPPFSILLNLFFVLFVTLSFSPAAFSKDRGLWPPIPKKYRGIKNPLPKNEKNLYSGERLYDINCSPCHGGNLDGNGPESSGFFPQPANIIGLVSVVKPPESYLFWRIKEGGPGLPKSWGSWNSAMPVWKGELKDREIWQIILYIYEAAGEVPP